MRGPGTGGNDHSLRLYYAIGCLHAYNAIALPHQSDRCLAAPQLRTDTAGGLSQGDGQAAVMDVGFIRKANTTLELRGESGLEP
jgi:hypothetical protein